MATLGYIGDSRLVGTSVLKSLLGTATRRYDALNRLLLF